MAKKTRKTSAAKAAKASKALTRKKAAATKKRRKIATRKKSKPAARKKPAGRKIVKPPPKSFPDKVAGAFTTVVDILTDAERLHRRLDPGVSREPE